jgi:hypothetical protein
MSRLHVLLLLVVPSTAALNRESGQHSPQFDKAQPPMATPLHYILIGTTVNTTVLLLSDATDAPTLAGLCVSTPSCGGFTLGSGGGEPGQSVCVCMCVCVCVCACVCPH